MASSILTPNPTTAIQSAAAAPTLIRASKTFTGAANLGAVGVNELFTTTGAVFIEGFWVRCTSDLVDAVDGALFRMGVTGEDGLLTGGNYEDVFDLDALDAGAGLSAETVGQVGDGFSDNRILFYGGLVAIFDSLIMTISGQAITGGVLEFYVLYRKLSADGELTLGAGMVAI